MDPDPLDRPDADPPGQLRSLVRGPDYFGEVGRGPRLAGAVLLAPVAAYFLLAAVIMPVPAAHFALKGEWPLAGMMLGLGAVHGVAGFALAWLVRRLWRGEPSANRRTVLPTWLVGAFLVGFLTPLGLWFAAMAGIAALKAAEDGNVRAAVLWGAGAVGSVAGLWRAYVTFARLVRGRPGG